MNQIDSKKIAILGGNPETGALVQVANGMGLHTIVLDPYPNSPAKRYAASAYDVDVTNLDAVDLILRDEGVAGVMVGVADPLVPFYQMICERNQMFCYATETIIHALTSKTSFAQTCSSYNVSVTPYFDVDISSHENIDRLDYPVVVKPVDAGAGVGISICRNPNEFLEGVSKALAVSLRKELRVEKFMQCDDTIVYYTFVDGVAYISAMADRFKTDKQGQSSPVCIAAEYPSRHIEQFAREVHPKLVTMFKALGIQNGVLLIGFFVDDQGFYAYDPGFRLQGEGPHLYLKHFNQFDHREMLLNFALTGRMWQGDFSQVNDSNFKGERATTVWVLLKAGRIGVIQGLKEIKSHPNVIEVLQRFQIGDDVTPDMLGTERQVFVRIYTKAKTSEKARSVVQFIHDTLVVTNESGADMVLDRYQPKD